MRIRITTEGKKVSVLFSPPERQYWLKSIILWYQYTDAHDYGVSYPEDALNLPHYHAGPETPIGHKGIVPPTRTYTPGQTIVECNDSKYWLVVYGTAQQFRLSIGSTADSRVY
jgi:hypothetical protein